jgi:S-DNA-T family DNA segregation ATPase FtsK/SpoIIIE
MARKKTKKTRKTKRKNMTKKEKNIFQDIHPEVQKNISIIFFLALAIIFILACFGQAGPWGNKFYIFFDTLFGWGYYLLPIVSFLIAFSFILPDERKLWKTTLLSALFFVISGLGLIDILSPANGGLTGQLIGLLEKPFGKIVSIIITGSITSGSLLIILNKPLHFMKLFKRTKNKFSDENFENKNKKIEFKISSPVDDEEDEESELKEESEKKERNSLKNLENKKDNNNEEKVENKEIEETDKIENFFSLGNKKTSGNYNEPPLSIFISKSKKPTSGDLKANANIIRRTLDSFGIQVDMGEVQIGPTVTRYTLKPAEGVKLSRITGLSSDLALALAAHPIRIEAPIPGKSLVGIEVPNKSAAIVRLGSILAKKDFKKTTPLTFILGRGVNGDPVFADIAKMPHVLIAGATGSGKSICIHTLLLSLLYKNSPDDLKLIMIDPKRVELSIYDDIPHLISPVITKNKKAVGALKWAINEMDRRYEVLLEEGVRDIKSYNSKNNKNMPYILIVIDELADLMASYGREVEGAIVRLAQMSRAVGIHLAVSTQRPSVEVITGLIKANITSRIALQVASGIDSRTIIDTSGAEKLLGNGDLLFVSSDSSKLQRIQGSFVTEKEIKDAVSYIKKNNELQNDEDFDIEEESKVSSPSIDFDKIESDEGKDELFEEAIQIVKESEKGSASLLQRKLRVGYARAARILDEMEQEGIVGPAKGSKAREVYLNKEEE